MRNDSNVQTEDQLLRHATSLRRYCRVSVSVSVALRMRRCPLASPRRVPSAECRVRVRLRVASAVDYRVEARPNPSSPFTLDKNRPRLSRSLYHRADSVRARYRRCCRCRCCSRSHRRLRIPISAARPNFRAHFFPFFPRHRLPRGPSAYLRLYVRLAPPLVPSLSSPFSRRRFSRLFRGGAAPLFLTACGSPNGRPPLPPCSPGVAAFRIRAPP